MNAKSDQFMVPVHEGTCHSDITTWGDNTSLMHVPAICPTKFNELNSGQHVAWEKMPAKSVLHKLEVISTNCKMGTSLCNMSLGFVPTTHCDFVTGDMSLLHVPGTCPLMC